MPQVNIRVDVGTYNRAMKMRNITGSLGKLLGRAVLTTDDTGISEPTTTFRRYSVNITQEVKDQIKLGCELLGMTEIGYASGMFAKYLFNLREPIEAHQVTIAPGVCGVVFFPDQLNKLTEYMGENDRSFGWVVKKAITSSEEDINVLPEEAIRCKGASKKKMYCRLSDKVAEHLSNRLAGKAISKSSAVRDVVMRFLNEQ